MEFFWCFLVVFLVFSGVILVFSWVFLVFPGGFSWCFLGCFLRFFSFFFFFFGGVFNVANLTKTPAKKVKLFSRGLYGTKEPQSLPEKKEAAWTRRGSTVHALARSQENRILEVVTRGEICEIFIDNIGVWVVTSYFFILLSNPLSRLMKILGKA